MREREKEKEGIQGRGTRETKAQSKEAPQVSANAKQDSNRGIWDTFTTIHPEQKAE